MPLALADMGVPMMIQRVGGNPAMRQHLADLGFVPGSEVTVISTLGGNMIVPGSFAMPDEDVRRLAAARGLLLNDHHVTPLGLNMYRWPEDVPFSYSRGKEYLRECWQTCVDTLKDYEKVWTVSFRGKNDHPYWQEDPFAPEDDAGRAAEIEEAIRTEIDLIRAADPDAVICFNMYNEQAKFYRAGLISLPEDITQLRKVMDYLNSFAGVTAEEVQ